MAAPTREDIQRIVDCIVEGYAPEKIILFGSAARGESDADSDIDLLIVKRTAESPYRRSTRVQRLIFDAQGMTPVDILVVTPEEIATGHVIAHFALREGITLHAA